MQQPEVAIYFFGKAPKGSQTYHKGDKKIKNPLLTFQVTVPFRLERHLARYKVFTIALIIVELQWNVLKSSYFYDTKHIIIWYTHYTYKAALEVERDHKV